ncbi:hypothetical protein Riv7116_0095 [Rivularia sp. PCC 7116]|uniref:hypothetical protein n=1 Tax=Rivularia sp. PCC 7116 TaxID=373994 RepID=UPI00029F0CA7|nr:hypothetical protein [Rivularia sp. PCC 7116]AFY52707.1 hypothetical protein Riv7116_0095 [Rivularia sp. PCC 7116]
MVITSSQVAIPTAKDTKALIDALSGKGYSPIPFPGCTTSVDDYLNWLKGKSNYENNEICEGFGIALRLQNSQDKILVELNNFFKSAIFQKTIEDKFGITRLTTIDSGLQKYLHGYEISPHPDIRKKAVTYMLNVNPSANSEDLDIHTHYLTFKPTKQFIGEFWHHNEDYDRCWVPWEWCNSIKEQRRNNSIVIFEPSWDTLHAIKLNYDHLQTQRTQFYGNLWYKDISPLAKPHHDQFDIQPNSERRTKIRKSIIQKVLSRLGY